MTELDRRSFLKTGAAATAGAAVVGGPFAGYLAAPAGAVRRRGSAPSPELVETPDLADGVVRLALPAGFHYRSFQESSLGAPLTLDDGSKLPGRHDGMAAFPARRDDDDDDDDRRGWRRHDHHDDDHDDDHDRHRRGRGSVLVRNHEENGSLAGGAFGLGVAPVYDSAARGGTSTVHVTNTGEVLYSFASLGGTQMNCSGGPMPWGSWVTCEETVNGPDVFDDFTRGSAPETTYIQNARLTRGHGYIFEVPAYGEASAEPITQAGRFAHEAVAFDPRGGSLYLTEDNFGFASGFYRYDPPVSPRRAGRLVDGGELWMLRVKGQPGKDLSGHFANGTSFDVDWVRIEDPDPTFPMAGGSPTTTNDQAIVAVGDQGRAVGAAIFSRLEGAVYDHGWVFWTSTQGGATVPGQAPPSGFGDGFGQIWGLDLKRQRLFMLYESPSREILDFPDNVTSSRRGTLVICEDGGDRNFLRGLTRRGEIFDIAQNALPSQPPPPAPSVPDRNDEFAGSTFSRDGRTLFVNIQDTIGRSFAIWGPWGRIGV
jgi:secreted PhoX family phosphatase